MSWVRPLAPKVCIARLAICTSMRGTITLMSDDLAPRRLVAVLVHEPGRLQHQEPRLLDLDARERDPFADGAVLVQHLAEGAALERALDHQLERQLGGAERAHAVMDAARPEPRLRQREAAAFLAQQIFGGTRTFSNSISQWPCGWRSCITGGLRTTVRPGVSRGTSTMLWRRCALGPVGARQAHDDEDLACAGRRRW